MIYFDTSFLTPLFRSEATSSRVARFFQEQQAEELAVSHWTRLEFSNVIARDVRMKVIEPEAAIQLDSQFDIDVMRAFIVILPNRDDFDLCRRYLHRFETSLRVGDAFHLAIASNHNARTFYTLDKKLLRAGKLLGLPVAAGIRG